MILLTLLAQTQTGPPGSAASPGGGFNLFVPLIFVLVIFYFIGIRPQARRQKEQQAIASVAKAAE